MASHDVTTPQTWRPQAFGRRSVRDVDDPLVEPLWSGIRVLAHVRPDLATFVDADGAEHRHPAIADALSGAVDADEIVLDGYLTADAAQSGEGIVTGDGPAPPTAGQTVRQLLVGGGRSDARQARDDAIATRLARREAGQPTGVVFVAVDLLALDGEPLLDVPLLERKRLLDAVVAEGELVRRGIHVRPPIDIWVRTWRSLGFREIAYKAANSRYTPGERNDAWATATIPPD